MTNLVLRGNQNFQKVLQNHIQSTLLHASISQYGTVLLLTRNSVYCIGQKTQTVESSVVDPNTLNLDLEPEVGPIWIRILGLC